MRAWHQPARPGARIAAAADQEADRAGTALYSLRYHSLVRLAALLVRDVAAAEEVVQDWFITMHDDWDRPTRGGVIPSQAEVDRSRFGLRHRIVVDWNTRNRPWNGVVA
jgi:hypothetical protein